MQDYVDAPDGVDLGSNVHLERNGDDGQGEDEVDGDEEKEDVEEVEEEDEDKGEDRNKDDGKEPWTIGLGEMVNTSADDADTIVEDEPTMLPKPVQKMRKYTPQPQPPAPALRPQTPESSPRPQTLETYTLSGLEFLGLVTPQNPQPAAPTL